MKVGFIGLGDMGLPMAMNVQRAGHELHIMRHRREEPVQTLSDGGAQVVDTPKEIAQACNVIITVLPADPQLEQVVLAKDGLIHGMREGHTLIDMTTGTPAIMKDIWLELDKQQISLLDAPVSGGTPAAADGTLTIMVGGDAHVLEAHRALLETMGKTIFHVGDVGQGKTVKMVNQLLAAIHLLAIGEAFSLGVKSGAEPGVLLEVIKVSSGHSKMMDLRLPNFLLEDSFKPGFKLDLMKKDVLLATQSAKDLGQPLFLGAIAAELFTAASGAGHGSDDFAAAAKYVTSLSQTSLAAAGHSDL